MHADSLVKFRVGFSPPSLLLEGLEEKLSERPPKPSAQGLSDGARGGGSFGWRRRRRAVAF